MNRIVRQVHSADDDSVDSNYDPEIPTLKTSGSVDGLVDMGSPLDGGECVRYDAATIRCEFKTYQHILPTPDKLLQREHSFTYLRKLMEQNDIEMPRFLRYKFEGGVKPHHALCCLLLSEYQANMQENAFGGKIYPSLVRLLSCGYLHHQINDPAEFIRDQFERVAPVVPTDRVSVSVLRKKIENEFLPTPNFFLDPDDDRQLPPHIALLVVLQDGESKRLNSIMNRLAFSSFAILALLLRIVLEVIGGAGAIWGGAEVFGLRTAENRELWRWISVAVGILCFLRFAILNAPQREDVGDILGPAGPWSLRLPVRLRAVCDHPFHYFVRAQPPPSSSPRKKDA